MYCLPTYNIVKQHTLATNIKQDRNLSELRWTVDEKEDFILISMDAQIFAVYRSESTGEYECFETLLPLSGTIELSEHFQNAIFLLCFNSNIGSVP